MQHNLSIRIILLILLPNLAFSQNGNIIFDLQYDRGKVLLSNDFVAFKNEQKKPLTFYEGASFRLLAQGDGEKNWQASLNLPYYGLGFSARDFRSTELGQSYSGYGILGIPILRTKPFEIFTELEYGMAFGWNHYDPLNNPYNLAIGSKMTVHAGARLVSKFHLGQHVDLNLGASFLHFSNGRFERPNNGLNIATYSVGLSFQPKERIKTTNIPEPLKENRSTEFALTLGYGSHQSVEILDNNYFNAAGINLSVAKRHTNLYQSRGVLDANYLWILTKKEDGSNGQVGWNNLTLGLMYQPEVTISKFTLVGGIGVYLRHTEYKPFKQLYQRLGVRYNITDYLSLASNIRSIQFYQAEFLEFQLGYHF